MEEEPGFHPALSLRRLFRRQCTFAYGAGAGVGFCAGGACAGALRVSGGFAASGVKVNFCPPTLASNINPLLGTVNTTTPCWYFALADFPSAAATALSPALKANFPSLNSFSAFGVSKKITSAYD